MEEPWEEALDLDDSDISSTFSLRRCPLQPPQPTSPLRSLSSLPSPSLPPPSPPPLPPPPSTSRRQIPGPAGAIQAAMRRTDHRAQNPEAVGISTQEEFIRRVQEDSAEDFSRNPWVFVLDFLRRDGMVDATPLSAIKKCGNSERIDKVVAIVKSCNPNGFGDMMITLKDPTDTISASVHRKVLTVGEFGKSIAVGSVLILQKVVAFSSSCASCYLNITRSNIVKVISVNCGVQSFPETNVLTIPEIPEKTSGLISRTEGTIRDVQHGYNLKGRGVIEKLMGKENSIQATSLVSNKPIENAVNKFSKEHIHIDLVDSRPKALGYFNKYRDGDNSYRSIQPGPVSAEGMSRNLEDLYNAKKRRQLRDFSSAPCIIENLESRHAWPGNGAQMGSSSGTSSSIAENPDGLGSCRTGTNDVLNRRQCSDEICSSPSMAENLASENICKINDSQKRRQVIDSVFNVSIDAREDDHEAKEANGAKKQRLALLSRTSVQEWTDEQLCILEVDED